MPTMHVKVITYSLRGATSEDVTFEVSEEFMAQQREAARWWQENGCHCKHPRRDATSLHPRGHSVDVRCTDCNGWRQIG